MAGYSCNNAESTGPVVSIGNGKINLSFERSTGKLISFSDISASYGYIDSAAVKSVPWLLNVAGDAPAIGNLPTEVRFKKVDPFTLEIKWMQSGSAQGPRVFVTVSLDKEKALSYWEIKVDGMKGLNIRDIQFPVLSGIRDLGDEKLVVSSWLGSLIDDPRLNLEEGTPPRTYTWAHPGSLSMQLLALYNEKSDGIYFSCNDSLAYTKDFVMTFDNKQLEYSIRNIPPFDNQMETYRPAYQAVIGSFKGDWMTAAKIYREWGVRQKWYRESRFKTGKIAAWLPETALWVWNRGKSPNVLPEAIDLKERVGLPVNVFWHWWHNCSYDDNFPEYIPPREGGASFIKAVTDAQQQGVHCIVYMNSFQWGDSSESWKTEHAEPYSAKTIDGGNYAHTFNIFSNKSLTPMCMATAFWRNKYASLCDSVVNVYRANGVYMDQACMNFRCYDKAHGHDPGGGNYWVNSFGELTSMIRNKISGENRPVLAGEGSGEDWIPYLDLFLTLETSRERYAGIGNWEPIPLYQAVYHDCAITYGSYSSLVYPPYDELWPAEYNPPDKETPLPADFNSQFLMEQARSFVWGMQPTIANYHALLAKERKAEIDFLIRLAKTRYNALKYLLYGVYCQTPEISSPHIDIDISKISIYAGRDGKSVTKFKKNVPIVYAGAWKASDDCLGIAIANIHDEQITTEFILNTAEYELPEDGEIYLITDTERKLMKTYSQEKVPVSLTMPARSTYVLEFIPHASETQLTGTSVR
jgi:hypothetical protein